MSRIEKSPVTLEVVQRVELEQGITLDPGCYQGERERTRTQYLGGPKAVRTDYFLKFNADQPKGMSGKLKPNILTKRICVSKLVGRGQITPRLTFLSLLAIAPDK